MPSRVNLRELQRGGLDAPSRVSCKVGTGLQLQSQACCFRCRVSSRNNGSSPTAVVADKETKRGQAASAQVGVLSAAASGTLQETEQEDESRRIALRKAWIRKGGK
ncbi:hypothetical protein CDD81_839 [Ophiocordyceps australis]|uniref:Uncharacterized protein n=1 Tax=Ophiocordyceps australis TaxID=1399860 RepID=A0A2C5XX30_9HYPO|nr:hypothetical protein CDD81_839 [Ophiocordyceps australis]